MPENFMQEMLIVAVAWLVMCIPVWLALWFIFSRLDRRPKDSVRCRRCWYDLRATTGDHCPECGADLTKTRVWPEGKPNRAKLVHFVMLWFWLGMMGAVLATNLYTRNRHKILKHYTLEQDIVYTVAPKSETHALGAVVLNGDGWVFFPGKHVDMKVPTASVSIVILSAGVEVQSVTLDPETMVFIPHPQPHLERSQEQTRAANNSSIQYGQEATPEALADFYPLGLDAETDRLLLAEMAVLLEAAKSCASGGPLLRSPEETGKTADDLAARVKNNGEYSTIKDLAYVYDYKTKDSSLWIPLIILGICILIIAGGVFLIRKWCYKRDTVAWEPSVSDATP